MVCVKSGLASNPHYTVQDVLSSKDSSRSLSFYRLSCLAIAITILIFTVFFNWIYQGSGELIFDRILLLAVALWLYRKGFSAGVEIRQYVFWCYLFFHLCTAHLILSASLNHFDGFYLLALLISFQFFTLTFRELKDLIRYHLIQTLLVLGALVIDPVLGQKEKWMFCGIIIAVSSLQYEASKMKIRFVGQIKMKEHMLRALFTNSEIAVFITDLNGSILDTNARVDELFGFAKHELVGRDFKVLRSNPLSDDELEQGLMELETKKYWSLESALVKKDGSQFPVRISMALIQGTYGRFLVYRVLDITQVKENELRLIEARNKAEEAVSAKSQFLAIMSHEIRTPMNGVVATSALLQQTNLDQQQQEYINTICKSGQSLLMLINDILDFSKMESGKMELSINPEQIDEAIHDVVDLLRPHAEMKGIALRAEVDRSVRGLVLTDINRLKQVFFNLIGNAIKFTQKGEVVVQMICQSASQGKICLHFEVSDTGIGIPEEKFHKLFQSFSQVDASISKNFGGTGLGLAISKQIVELLGGTIQVKSELGKGTTFYFDLSMDHISEQMQQRMELNGEKEVEFDYSRIKMLIAEDNEINRQVLSFILDKLGVKYEFALNGLEAVEKCRTTNYDIIFTDLNMPVMDGFEATRIIRREMNWQPPVIAVSAISFEEEKKDCYAAGMNDFLPKPFALDTLKMMLRKWSNEAGNEQVAA